MQLTPNLAYTLPGIWHGVADFSGFVDGTNAMSGDGPGRDAKEEISDRVRVLCEQCDGLQGEKGRGGEVGGPRSMGKTIEGGGTARCPTAGRGPV